MSDNLKKKTIKGVGWSFTDTILRNGIGFVVGLVLARLLSPSEYGLIGIVTIFTALFNTIVDSGFSNALIRKQNVTNDDMNTVFILNMSISILMAIAMFFAAPLISRFFHQEMLTPISKVMSVVIVVNAFTIVPKTILTKRLDFKKQTMITVVSVVSSGVLGIVMAFMGFGVWSLVAQSISSQVIQMVLLWILVKWFPSCSFSKSSFNELFGFGWKLLVSSLINTLWKQLYQIVVGRCYSVETLGLYSRARHMCQLCSNNLTEVVQRVSYPSLSTIQDDVSHLKSAYRKIIKVTMLVTFVLVLGMAACSKQLVYVLIGEKWLPCVPYLQLICFSSILYPLHAINLNMLQVQGRSDLFLKLEIIKKIIAVGPLLLGIFVNIYWMLGGAIVVGFIDFYLNAYYSGPFLKYSVWDQIKDIIPSFLLALFMAAVVYVMSYIHLSPFILFPIQLITGASITIGLCEMLQIDEYKEIKGVCLSFIHR